MMAPGGIAIAADDVGLALADWTWASDLSRTLETRTNGKRNWDDDEEDWDDDDWEDDWEDDEDDDEEED